jgi:hypothetical protein
VFGGLLEAPRDVLDDLARRPLPFRARLRPGAAALLTGRNQLRERSPAFRECRIEINHGGLLFGQVNHSFSSVTAFCQ